MNVPGLLNARDALPDIMLPMFVGAPPVLNVTLCAEVVPCHAQVTVVLRGTVIDWGEKKLLSTPTVVTTAAVVVNVTLGDRGNPVAVAVAVWAPVPDPRVRTAVALPFACVVFCAGAIEPPPVATAQSMTTPPFALPCVSRDCTV